MHTAALLNALTSATVNSEGAKMFFGSLFGDIQRLLAVVGFLDFLDLWNSEKMNKVSSWY